MRLSAAAGTRPVATSTWAVPSVGCPANGSSMRGVKIRTFRVCRESPGGNTNTVSERAISRAMACISAAVSPFASGNTASALPVSGALVKTSAVWKENRRRVASPALTAASVGQAVAEGEERVVLGVAHG